MPRVNVYIKNEDWEIWLAIADKPKWLHDNLNSLEAKPILKLQPKRIIRNEFCKQHDMNKEFCEFMKHK